MPAEENEGAKPEWPPVIKIGDSEMFAVPASVSQARAEALFPSKPSEDARHILGHIDVPLRHTRGGLREYLPHDRIQWVVTCDFGGAKYDPKAVSAAFDKEWRKRSGGFMGYGKDATTGRWTYLASPDAPKEITAAKLAWRLAHPNQIDSIERFESRLDEVKAKLSVLGPCKIDANLGAADAVARSQQLQKLRKQFDLRAVLKLVCTDGPFDGREVWDVLLCLGLKWGDMDCFHWENRNDQGDQAHFSVQTSTRPGYFLPEQVAAGQMNPKDLVFVFSIPRSAAPVQVFKSMCRAVEYCKKRLGGRITFSSGQDADMATMENDIVQIEAGLKAQGFVPGSSDALRFF